MLSGSADTTAILWDLKTGKPIGDPLKGHSKAINAVAFSPDGNYLFTASDDGTVVMWDAQTREKVRTFSGHARAVNTVALSPDGGHYLLTGSADATAKLWDVATGKAIYTFQSHKNGINSVAFSPDGKSVFTSSSDETIQWDFATKTKSNDVSPKNSTNSTVLFSPDTKYMLKLYEGDGSASIYRSSDGSFKGDLTGQHINRVASGAFSSQGDYVVTGSDDQTARLWSVSNDKPLRVFSGHVGSIRSVTFSNDSAGSLVATGSDDTDIRIWNTGLGPDTRRLSAYCGCYIGSAMYSPDNSQVLTFIGGEPSLWDSRTGVLQRNFNNDAIDENSGVFAPDGKTILTGGRSGVVRQWTMPKGNIQREFVESIHTGQFIGDIASVIFSPDGQMVAAAGSDHAVLWDVSTGTELRVLPTANARQISFSPDSRSILIVSSDQGMILWDVATGKLLRTFNVGKGSVNSAVFSSDSKFIVTGSDDATVSRWDISTGQPVLSYVGNTDAVNSVAISPDGHYIVTGGKDNTIRLFDTESGTENRTLAGHSGGVISVSFSPDGKTILSTGGDYTLRIWDVESADLLSFACSNLVRDFTDGERKLYDIDNTATCQSTNMQAADLTPTSSSPVVATLSSTSTPIPAYATEIAQFLATAQPLDSQLKSLEPSANRVYGPLDGSLVHDPSTYSIKLKRANVSLSNFVVSARIYNPYSPSAHVWDYGFIFHYTSYAEIHLIVDSDRMWSVEVFRNGSYVDSLKIENKLPASFDTMEGHSNQLNLVVVGNAAYFSINGSYVASFDASAVRSLGDVAIATGLESNDEAKGASTRYEDFTVWKLTVSPKSSLASTLAPINTQAASTAIINMTLSAQTSATANSMDQWIQAVAPQANREYGPANGQLDHKPDAHTIIWQLANVSLANFAVSSRFYNPYSPTSHSWDYGFVFHQISGSEMILDITSQQTWEVLEYDDNRWIKLEVGALPTLDNSEGHSNQLDLFVSGNNGFFLLNGVYAASFDASAMQNSGDIAVITGFQADDQVKDASTRYENFTVWGISGSALDVARNIQATGTAQALATFIAPNLSSVGSAYDATLHQSFYAPNGVLQPTPGQLSLFSAEQHVRDFGAEVRFYNPAKTSAPWDYDLFFRDEGGSKQYHLDINSAGAWKIGYASSTQPIASGKLANLNTSPNGSNLIQLIVVGAQGTLYVNNIKIQTFDTSLSQAYGNIYLVTGDFGTSNNVSPIGYENFRVWSIGPDASVTPTQTLTPTMTLTLGVIPAQSLTPSATIHFSSPTPILTATMPQ